MSVGIFYFTGTGNSLDVARTVAARLHADLTPLASALRRRVTETDADAVGFVFPCYLAQLHGVPLIVEDFVAEWGDLSGKYVFAICTYGGFGPVNALPTLERFGRIVRARGGSLSGSFSVRLPLNNLDYEHIPVPLSRDQTAMLRNASLTIDTVCRTIAGRRPSRNRLLKAAVSRVMAPLYRAMAGQIVAALRVAAEVPAEACVGYRELMRHSDRSIVVDDECDGCGTCARVCPARNIELVDHRPSWKHRCEMCLACDEWCPQRAVHHWCKTVGKNYRHPNVTLADIVAQNE